jgi:hypothetical protein
MVRPSDGCGMAIHNRSPVLMARIVDNTGRIIRPAEVDKIKYWIYEFDRNAQRGVVPRHDGIAINVPQVLFDALQNGDLWSLDALGYNFRHAFDFTQSDTCAMAGKHFDVRYEFTPKIGQKAIIRFQLGSLSR